MWTISVHGLCVRMYCTSMLSSILLKSIGNEYGVSDPDQTICMVAGAFLFRFERFISRFFYVLCLHCIAPLVLVLSFFPSLSPALHISRITFCLWILLFFHLHFAKS